jgi:RimJ/RimL family protein N-acetyltransferase
MRLVVGRDKEVAAWVASLLPQIDGDEDFGPYTAIGVTSESGDPSAGVVFHNFVPRYRGLEITMASVTPRWVTRDVLRGIMAYPFEQLDCVAVRTVTPRKNKAALRFNRKMGFKIDGVMRRGFGSQDAIVCSMLAKEWRASRFNLRRDEMAEAA